MREATSASCFWLSAFVKASAKWARGIVVGSRCGFTNAAACGTATWEWMSMVVLAGLVSRPGLPCLRAAVRSYLFHCAGIDVLSARRVGKFVDGYSRVGKSRQVYAVCASLTVPRARFCPRGCVEQRAPLPTLQAIIRTLPSVAIPWHHRAAPRLRRPG